MTLDETKKQTKRIMQMIAHNACTGLKIIYNPLITEGMNKLDRINVIIPFAEKLEEKLTECPLIIRTKISRIIDLIKASTALHQLQRKQNKEGFFLAEKQDYILIKEIFENFINMQKFNPLTLHQESIIEAFKKSIGTKFTTEGFLEVTNRSIISDFHNMQKNLEELTHLQILKQFIEINPITNRQATFYTLNPKYLEDENKLILPSIADIFHK
jgi:hypothetical protein